MPSSDINVAVSIGIYRENAVNGMYTDLVLSQEGILYLCDREFNGRIFDSSELFTCSIDKIDSLIYALQQMKSFAV
ncbi:hypothetical protein PP749_gp028 [Rhizobium phage RHEph22]|uniref:Uncharacterized protein n=1 Tax=Rhizobium phage RHEph22 TaxID=2836135 RepID=A0AAE7VMU6_9CAUD|nr:hypothetical protein PP749_gp028 [Rhizobium phage RHEph22]QXV74701.1 hypothetical protein [Rhizobium phage RHEph22]QXV74796.1 hypothetical protein [Rhizobium phage RHEph24]